MLALILKKRKNRKLKNEVNMKNMNVVNNSEFESNEKENSGYEENL